MGGLRITYRVALYVGLAVLGAGPVYAQSDICARLEARLMALDSRVDGGNADKIRDYDRSIADLREDLDRARAEARSAGCMGTFFRRLRSDASCGPMMASIDRMRANLRRLTAARDRAGDSPSAGSRERSELIRALSANRCGAHYDDYAQRGGRRGFLSSLFGGRMFRDRGWGRDDFFGGGTFRTLCVRSCDGYYFPISFSAVRSQFARDEQMCRARCPGTDVALYVHRNPGEESESMVSLAGEPYTLLPAAYSYREKYDPTCKCGQIAVSPDIPAEVAGLVQAPGDDPWGFARDAQSDRLPGDPQPLPPTRPAAGEDPETLANRAGSISPRPVAQPEPTIAAIGADGERKVRIVGPAFFYGQ